MRMCCCQTARCMLLMSSRLLCIQGENQFLRDPKRSVMGDGFQPHELLDPGKKAGEAAQN